MSSLFRVAHQNYRPVRHLVEEISTSHSIKSEISKYKSMTALGFVPIGGLIIYLFVIKSHEHSHKDDPHRPYVDIRTRRFPWGEGELSLFNHLSEFLFGKKEHHDHH